MKNLIPKFLISMISMGITLSFLTPCYAGDEMNIDFLIHKAVLKSSDLKTHQKEIQDELYNTSFINHVTAGMAVIAEGIWGASIGTRNSGADIVLGVPATILGAGATIISDVSDTRNLRQVRQLMGQVRMQQQQIEGMVRTFYPAFKNGSSEAREHLVTLTSDNNVSEVELNLAIETYFKSTLQKKVSIVPKQAETSVFQPVDFTKADTKNLPIK